MLKYCITESTKHERKDSSQYLKILNYPKNMTNPKKNMVGQEKYALTLTRYPLRIDSTAKHEKKELASNIWDLTLKQLRPTRSYESKRGPQSRQTQREAACTSGKQVSEVHPSHQSFQKKNSLLSKTTFKNSTSRRTQ